MLNTHGTNLSGSTYVRTKLRSDTPHPKNWFALILRRPSRCAHGGSDYDLNDMPTICTKCAEWWSWDHDMEMARTGAGRQLAQDLGLDPLTATTTLRYRDGYEKAGTA